MLPAEQQIPLPAATPVSEKDPTSITHLAKVPSSFHRGRSILTQATDLPSQLEQD